MRPYRLTPRIAASHTRLSGAANRMAEAAMLRAFRFVQVLLGVALLASGPAAADNVLRVSPHADLKVVDPHATTATITIMHALMIYDMLYGWDENLQPKPQMVGSETISPDKLTYTFTLRDGLKFHDGSPVTTR